MEDKEVADLLSRAYAAVQGSGIPPELHGDALGVAAALLNGANLAPAKEQPARAATPAKEQPAGAATPAAPAASVRPSGSEAIDAIASGVGLDGADVLRVFVDKNGEPELKIKASLLPGTKAEAAREIALLVMAARQLAGVDDYTDAETLVAVTKQYGKYDRKNHATALGKLDHLVMTGGVRGSKTRKLTFPGLEEAGEVIHKYANPT